MSWHSPTTLTPPLQKTTGCSAQRLPLDVLNGGMTSVSSQASGAQRRLRGACESQTRAAPAYALRVSVLASRRRNGTTRRSSLQVLKGAAASQGRLEKSFILGYAQWADRGVSVAVLSESDSAPPLLKNGSGEDADPPGSRRTAFHGKVIVPHGPGLQPRSGVGEPLLDRFSQESF